MTSFRESFRCPRCHSDLVWSDVDGHCRRCDCGVTVRGGRIYDFAAELPWSSVGIPEWTATFAESVESRLMGLSDGPRPTEGLAGLVEAGLASADSELTATGRKVAYHLAEFRRQAESREIEDLRGFAAIGPESRVLDVGCGAGQSLRLLGVSSPAELVGVDIDSEALALGARLVGPAGETTHFVRSTGDALPFESGRFTHAICRVALNYMNQGNVINQLMRVLRPGGLLYCLIEGPGFDLSLLRRARGWRRGLCCLRNLAWGVSLEVVGWQPTPGRPWSGDRAFATPRRLGRLAGRDFEPVRVRIASRFAGFPTAYELMARKQGSGDEAPANLARGRDPGPVP